MTSIQQIQYQYDYPNNGLDVSGYNSHSGASPSPGHTPPAPSHSIPIVQVATAPQQLSPGAGRMVYCSSPISSGPQTPDGMRRMEEMFASGLCAQEPYVWMPPQQHNFVSVSSSPVAHLSPMPSPTSFFYTTENAQPTFVFPPQQQQYLYAPVPAQFAVTMQPPSPGGYNNYTYQHQSSAPHYFDNHSNHSGSAQSSPVKVTKSKLPSCYLTESGEIGINIGMVVERNLIEQFACDKTGCHFLQAQFPLCKPMVRQKIFERVVHNDDVFALLVRDVFGNFLIQKMLEVGNAKEHADLASKLNVDKYGQNRVYSLCQDRYSCRVVQKAIECLPDPLRWPLAASLSGREIALTLDQNGNHVIQRILHHFSPANCEFIIKAYVADRATLQTVVENKYGCRVVQVALEELCAAPYGKTLLRLLLNALLNDCERFVSNEFANYVMQHIIMTDSLAEQREFIIEECIRGKVLRLSQDKYASHVVEKAFKHASRSGVRGEKPALDMLMLEVLEGYYCDEQGREALDIMMFDQFGNYVVQTMLSIAQEMRHEQERAKWFEKLALRIVHNRSRLAKYSSGKKIIEQLKCMMGPNMSDGTAEYATDENQNTPTFANKYGRIALPGPYRGH